MQPLSSDGTVSRLLGQLGITTAETQDVVTSAVIAELTRCGLVGQVTGIRWGCLTIESDPVTVAALLWHRERLEHLVQEVSDGKVTGIRLRTSQTGGAQR